MSCIKHERGNISKHRGESWKYDAQRSIFDELRGVWKCDETLFQVFDKEVRRSIIVKELCELRLDFQTIVTVLVSFVLKSFVSNVLHKNFFARTDNNRDLKDC